MNKILIISIGTYTHIVQLYILVKFGKWVKSLR